jgi:hypothetical protein
MGDPVGALRHPAEALAPDGGASTVRVTRDMRRLDRRERMGRRPRANSRIVLWLRPDSLTRRVTFRFRSDALRRSPSAAPHRA